MSITSSISRSSSGVCQVVRDLSLACYHQGVPLEVLALADADVGTDYANLTFPYRIFSSKGPRSFGYSPGMRDTLMHSDSQLFHVHGLWMYPGMAAGSVGRRRNIPVIISPHGMLSAWATEYKSFKKKLALLVYQRRDLASAAVLHATSTMEVDDLRALGLKQPIAVIPNGVETHAPTNGDVVDTSPRVALFLARIHPIKGLLNLVAAWAKVRPEGWRLVIAGPDEVGHQAEVARAAELAGILNCIEFVGPVYGDAKWDLYSKASLFVLPSFTENFGIVVAEALASEVPVITTKGAPWRELQERECGWWIDIGVDPLAAALQDATTRAQEELNVMGERGRSLVKERYLWPSIAARMIAVYAWMLGQGGCPECIRTE